MALAGADVVLPLLQGLHDTDVTLLARVRSQVSDLVEPLGPHRLVEVAVEGLDEVLRSSPVRLSSMGRDLDDDRRASWQPRRQAATRLHSASIH